MPAAPNTSASGGVLRPSAAPAPIYGRTLLTAIQDLVAGVTGLAGAMVRPSYQAEPPTIPDAGDAWAAVRVTTAPSDTFPAVIHKTDSESPQGFDRLQRNEAINVLTSFYDLGVDGLADTYMALLRDGLAIPQNLDSVRQYGIKLNSVGTPVVVPVIVKLRWLYRVDFPFILMRQVVRDYRVESVLSATGQIVTDDGIVVEIDVPAPSAT